MGEDVREVIIDDGHVPVWDGVDYFLDDVPMIDLKRYSVPMLFEEPSTGMYHVGVRQKTSGDFNHFHLVDWVRYQFPTVADLTYGPVLVTFMLTKHDALIFRMLMSDAIMEGTLDP